MSQVTKAILGLIPVALALSGEPLQLEIHQSSGYAIFEPVPSFLLLYQRPGFFAFSCRHWLLADGEYLVQLGPSDYELLMSLIADIEATSPSPPEYFLSGHHAEFGVHRLTARGEFSSRVSVASLRGSRFEALHSLVSRLVRDNCSIVRYQPAVDFEIIDTRTGKPPLPGR